MALPAFTLVLASLALLIGPTVGSSGGTSPRLAATNDGFTVALVVALCAVLVLPHVIADLGFVGAALVAAGGAVPTALRRLHVRLQWSAGLVLALVTVHAAIDGAVLSLGHGDGSGALSWAVIAHRIPFGFALFAWAARSAPTRPSAIRIAWAGAAVMVAFTVAGFIAGSAALELLPAQAPEAIEAVVAGALLAMVLAPRPARERRGGVARDDEPEHRTHGHGHDQHAEEHHAPWAGIGALAGAAVFLGAATAGGMGLNSPPLAAASRTLWALLLETAPALLLGFVLAGIVPFVLTGPAIGSSRRGGRLVQAARGVAYGLPLPICSCGVLPVYQSLVRRGAPPVAALAFFIATPELGLDAVLLSVPLLGESLTIARVVAAVAVALIVALLVSGPDQPSTASLSEDVGGERGTVDWRERLEAGLRFGFVEVFDHTMPWIAIGLFVAAFGEPILAENALHEVHPFLQVPLATLVAMPVYVCASGATPIAALAIHKGLSAGAALAFLIAGPATNVTTFGVLARLHGVRMAVVFGAAVSVLAILAGWTVDALGVQAEPLAGMHAARETGSPLLGLVCAAVLAVLVAASVIRQGPRGVLRHVTSPLHAQ